MPLMPHARIPSCFMLRFPHAFDDDLVLAALTLATSGVRASRHQARKHHHGCQGAMLCSCACSPHTCTSSLPAYPRVCSTIVCPPSSCPPFLPMRPSPLCPALSSLCPQPPLPSPSFTLALLSPHPPLRSASLALTLLCPHPPCPGLGSAHRFWLREGTACMECTGP